MLFVCGFAGLRENNDTEINDETDRKCMLNFIENLIDHVRMLIQTCDDFLCLVMLIQARQFLEVNRKFTFLAPKAHHQAHLL